jgi:hypothetical protein
LYQRSSGGFVVSIPDRALASEDAEDPEICWAVCLIVCDAGDVLIRWALRVG